MSSITPVIVDVTEKNASGVSNGLTVGQYRITWSTVTENDTCVSVPVSQYPVKSLHVLGTFGGATVVVQGSNEPMYTADGSCHFVSLRNAAHSAISIATNADLEEILESVQRIRPSASGGSGQSLTFVLLCSTPARR